MSGPTSAPATPAAASGPAVPGPVAGSPRRFDPFGDLPRGTVVLEASAGTGKTHTIATLTTRYVAEGVAALPEIMLVTFGRAATSELRDRVRERLVATERALRGHDPAHSADELVTFLAAVDADELARRRERLRVALSQLDAATITTTHGFCQQMLTALGTAADVDLATSFLPDVADLVEEVTDDLYVRRFADQSEPILSPRDVRAVARAAVSDHGAVVAPSDAAEGSVAAARYEVAVAARREVEARKRAMHLLDYDDLLVLLRRALTDPEHGATATQRVRSRFRVVMVDEFQDTDPEQWAILRTAFHGRPDESSALVLIGDPKQAIYAFRGADVVTYLQAVEDATDTATLSTSWRSDGPLLAGLHALLGETALGDPRIVVRPVDAAHPEARFSGGAPVRLRQVTRRAYRLGASSAPSAPDARGLLAKDVAADVASRLGTASGGGDRVRDDAGGAASDAARWRPLEPRDVAVLTRTNAQAEAVRSALVALGVPAVVSGPSSVFGSAAAQDWLTLLAALEQPGLHRRATALALTPFVGWDAQRLATADDADHDELGDTVRAWAHLLADRGVAAVAEVAARRGATARVMARADGERYLTDLRHVTHALHEAATTEGLGTAALTAWLRTRIAEVGTVFTDERTRRLETDAAAVQVVTVHAAKGLEFGVVYVPFGWERFEPDDQELFAFHDDHGQRVLHLGGVGSPGFVDAKARWRDEELGEDLRLLYVALTRARHQVVVHWTPTKRSTGSGPLTRLLLADRMLGGEPGRHARPDAMRDDAVRSAFEAVAARSGGTVVVEQVDARPKGEPWSPGTRSGTDLALATAVHLPDRDWRRASYSALTAAAHHGPVGGIESEPEDPGVQDEPEETTDDDTAAPSAPASTPRPGADVPSPYEGQPGGTAFGTLVHEILEYVDTAADDLDAEVRARCAQAATVRVPGVEPVALATALGLSLRTPLGPIAGGLTLADVDPRDRLPELEFELPLAGGDETEGVRPATLRDLADVLRAHLPADDAFARYPDLLAALADESETGTSTGGVPLRGYLTGSIDAVLRVPAPGPDGAPDGDPGGRHRYLVVDYKTNRVGPPGVPLAVGDYHPDAMRDAMLASHYPLQLVLYLVALHRYLRWRVRDYDPDRDLAGGAYLFVRGMAGPDTPRGPDGTPYGVVAWSPPPGLVVALSALLDGGRA
ncbi:UvrD-helicase domain-containing protein [Cellulosimicrobium funkei]|uniref:RecBCD enzyme subunit RecB n=1 Tax=Cellulosimicrobium funkei TaxID=264251 RepID=A0A4Y8R3Y4_9MICO|nr:UvrD-helicase domain-containing protein [Cellulosimicrobium funkei]TFF12785.1 exodeoxyribonuclease V [Cellulosimicrobium funkei]TGA77094.1 exodeoxyribonuclease V [Cellulosimicrobium terreum]